jgi:epoxide hydrolase-like predicted phosphatase
MGKNHQIDAVVFDIGGVLIEFEFDRAFRAASAAVGIPPQEIRARLFGKSDFAYYDRELDVVAFECGRISDREFHSRVEKLLNSRIPFEHFCTAWNGIFTGEIKSTLELMHELRQRPDIKVGVLSNTNSLHFNLLRQSMTVFNEMDHVYVSHEIGCRKPDAESYLHVLKSMNVSPERSVFVDDLPENIAAAQKVGMKTVHATNPKAVHEGLIALGLF